MGFFLVWVLCAFIGAALLSSSNRAGTGFVLGFILGPIGVIIAAVMASGSAGRAREEDAAISRGELRKCPMCAEAIRFEALKCKHCGSEVPPAAAPSTRSAGLQDVTCHSCGFVHSPFEDYCPKCGLGQDGSVRKPWNPATKLFAVVFFGIIVVAAIIAFTS